MDTWFISDTHFGHRNIVGYCRPEFQFVEDMDEALIQNWNKRVNPGDRVYHLGDFAISPKHAAAVRPRLNGTIRLIVGNHDDIPKLVSLGLFQRVQLWRAFKEHGFTATHIPLAKAQLRCGTFNVHGHVHIEESGLEPHHLNICVEQTNYAPLHLDEVLHKLMEREAKL